MDSTVNTRLLLDETDSDSGNDSDIRNDLNTILETSLGGDDDSNPLFKPHEPIDKYYTCYLIFYLLGVTSLLPWYFFITANDYWMYKFRKVGDNNISSLFTTQGNRTILQKEFTSYLNVASAVPSTIFLILSPFINHKISLQIRMIGSLLVMIIFFIITTVLVNIDTDTWQYDFFLLTLAIVVILNIFSAILSGSLYGLVGKFNPAYITAVISGQALGGIFTVLVEIISLAMGESSTHSAFLYFIIGNCILIVTLLLYFILTKSVFFQYHIRQKPDIGIVSIQTELRPLTISFTAVFNKIYVFGISECVVFAVTTVVYPGVTVLIESESKGSGSKWSELYFVPVVCYLIFNIGDYIGRLLAGNFQWLHHKGLLILALNFTRFAFIPLLLLCNAQPRHHFPVLIRSDVIYIIIMSLLSLTNGYLANIAIICAARNVDHHEKETASSMMVAFLGIGLSLGSVINLLIVKIL